MVADSIPSRRKVLAGLGGVAGLGGIGYLGARAVSRRGAIEMRFVIGHEVDDGARRPTDIYEGYYDPDGPQDHRFDPAYRQHFPDEPPITVSQSAHRALQREFDEIVYVVRHVCREASCSAPQVSRSDFNSATLGEEVRLLYHSGDSATILP